LLCDQGLSVGLCTQSYNSLCASVDLLRTTSDFTSITCKQDHCARPRPDTRKTKTKTKDNITDC